MWENTWCLQTLNGPTGELQIVDRRRKDETFWGKREKMYLFKFAYLTTEKPV